MDLTLKEPSWQEFFQNEQKQDYFNFLRTFLEREYSYFEIFPPNNLLFRAFELCPLDKVRVVILGQDPYHGKNQAEGLAFSVPQGEILPPSLRNIFFELKVSSTNGSLVNWAKNGILLLNTTLTVRSGQPLSHRGAGWELFTDNAIRYISDNKKSIVFMLWGANAKSKKRFIDTSKHLVLEANHPSPLSANRGGWFGCSGFDKAKYFCKDETLFNL